MKTAFNRRTVILAAALGAGTTFLQACGGSDDEPQRNIVELAKNTPDLSILVEAVVAADPDVIVTGLNGRDAPDGLDGWRRFTRLEAVRTGALIAVDPDTLHRSSDRIVDGLDQLCARLDAVRARR